MRRANTDQPFCFFPRQPAVPLDLTGEHPNLRESIDPLAPVEVANHQLVKLLLGDFCNEDAELIPLLPELGQFADELPELVSGEFSVFFIHFEILFDALLLSNGLDLASEKWRLDVSSGQVAQTRHRKT